MIQPAVLRGRASYERTMEGWTDDADGDALAHTVRLTDADRQIELRAVTTTSPTYEIRHASCRVLGGDVASVGAGIASMIQPNTRLIWMESPGSVTMEVPDTEAIVAAAKARGVLTAIDNTWSAGVYYRPFEKGIDISVQALTKYQSGGSDVLMGAVITRDDHLHDRLKRTRMLMGWGVSADDCYLVLRGLASMPVRLAAHDRAAAHDGQIVKLDHGRDEGAAFRGYARRAGG